MVKSYEKYQNTDLFDGMGRWLMLTTAIGIGGISLGLMESPVLYKKALGVAGLVGAAMIGSGAVKKKKLLI